MRGINMNLYTNAFFCSMRNDGGEVIIRFVQNGPSFTKGEPPSQEIVSSLVMDRNTAQRLLDSLGDLLSE